MGEMSLKEELKYAEKEFGELLLTPAGALLMHKSLAGNWAILLNVSMSKIMKYKYFSSNFIS